MDNVGVLEIMLYTATFYVQSKTHFFKWKKAILPIAAIVPIFTIITPGPYTRSKQSKMFLPKGSLKVTCEKRKSLITESDCICVTDLNRTVIQKCHVIVVFSYIV